MTTYVLVPGFWLGGWVWDAVAEQLRAGGHEVHAVTLTGLAERAGEAGPDVDLDTHIADILAVTEGLRDVVLVGHSGANMPVTGAADRLAGTGTLARVVYVDSGPLPSGMAQLDFADPDERAEVLRQVGDGSLIPVPAFEQAADPAQLADLTAEQLAALRERGTPQPVKTATQPLLRPDPLPEIAQQLIVCTFPLAVVHQLAAGGNPVFALMAGPQWTYAELPTGHYPMLSKPKELAELLMAG
jgi:pimeloyl-ACP methyl ester carboxylesterase